MAKQLMVRRCDLLQNRFQVSGLSISRHCSDFGITIWKFRTGMSASDGLEPLHYQDMNIGELWSAELYTPVQMPTPKGSARLL